MTYASSDFWQGFKTAAALDPTINLHGKADHKKDSRYPEDELKKGRKHEREHTNNPEVAKQIAKDHLEEDRHYYIHLDKAKLAFCMGFDKAAGLDALRKPLSRGQFPVYVRKIFNEKTKTPKRRFMAGGFGYSFTPDGPIAGKVGAGMSHTLKKDMALNPDKYVGKAARVAAHRSGENSKLTGSAFLGWHG